MGHIHIGYDRPNNITNNYIVKALDLFISVPLVLMEPTNKRKIMYGTAGSYRTTTYGVEYRSTSNYIFSSPELMEWTFNQIKKAIDFINAGSFSELSYYESTIRECINSNNEKSAKEIINKFRIETLTTIETKISK